MLVTLTMKLKLHFCYFFYIFGFFDGDSFFPTVCHAAAAHIFSPSFHIGCKKLMSDEYISNKTIGNVIIAIN